MNPPCIGPKHLTIFDEAIVVLLTNAVNLLIKLTKPPVIVVKWRSMAAEVAFPSDDS